MAFLTEDVQVRDTLVDHWVRKQQLDKIGEAWARGLEPDWKRLYGEIKPRRISMPTYPFAKERYWVTNDALISQQTPRGLAALHPLLHVNVSDLQTQAYRSTFSGEEFFLKDHRVRLEGGIVHPVLPGMAHLEMARAALADALKSWPGSLELRDIVWIKPILVADRRQIFVTLAAAQHESSGDQLDYRIFSKNGNEEIVHSRGHATFNLDAAPGRLDIASLRAQMNVGQLSPGEIYAAFARSGLHYGPAHRGVIAIHRGNGQVLAHLRLPPSGGPSKEEFVLHPSMMDAAVQALIGLTQDLEQLPRAPLVPFALEYLHVVSAWQEDMLVWLRHSPGSRQGREVTYVDIDLCDAEGNICVRMRGLAGRLLSEGPGSNKEEIVSSADGLSFDSQFYRTLIDRIAEKQVSVDEAINLE